MNPLTESVHELARRLAQIEEEHKVPGYACVFTEDAEEEWRQELAQERDAKMRKEIRKFTEAHG